MYICIDKLKSACSNPYEKTAVYILGAIRKYRLQTVNYWSYNSTALNCQCMNCLSKFVQGETIRVRMLLSCLQYRILSWGWGIYGVGCENRRGIQV